jgi:hypothetical protein
MVSAERRGTGFAAERAIRVSSTTLTRIASPLKPSSRDIWMRRALHGKVTSFTSTAVQVRANFDQPPVQA